MFETLLETVAGGMNLNAEQIGCDRLVPVVGFDKFRSIDAWGERPNRNFP
jgi:hypothetical protein